MITCSVCGCLNDPSNAVCEECGSDLIDESELIAMYEEDDYEDDDDEFFTNILDDEIPDDEILKELDKYEDDDEKEDE